MEPDAFVFREEIHQRRVLNGYKLRYRTAVSPKLGYAYPRGTNQDT